MPFLFQLTSLLALACVWSLSLEAVECGLHLKGMTHSRLQRIKPILNPTQQKVIDAMLTHPTIEAMAGMSVSQLAKEAGVSESSAGNALRAIEKEALEMVEIESQPVTAFWPVVRPLLAARDANLFENVFIAGRGGSIDLSEYGVGPRRFSDAHAGYRRAILAVHVVLLINTLEGPALVELGKKLQQYRGGVSTAIPTWKYLLANRGRLVPVEVKLLDNQLRVASANLTNPPASVELALRAIRGLASNATYIPGLYSGVSGLQPEVLMEIREYFQARVANIKPNLTTERFLKDAGEYDLWKYIAGYADGTRPLDRAEVESIARFFRLEPEEVFSVVARRPIIRPHWTYDRQTQNWIRYGEIENYPLSSLELPAEIQDVLTSGGYRKVGPLIRADSEHLLALNGFLPEYLPKIRRALYKIEHPAPPSER